ncbi:hypothetical protein ES319_D05G315300v1 [Gossypium barbadense]|uniref:Uncharacterized protein n=1 Tax=Gossypium barbadense TaxID=3634 RepID=A0A5J5RKG7_GOSBA|nr:hypothetical protein ES319_D05G315300v1 [Gossypium barbadense]
MTKDTHQGQCSHRAPELQHTMKYPTPMKQQSHPNPTHLRTPNSSTHSPLKHKTRHRLTP